MSAPPIRPDGVWKVGKPLIGCRFDPSGRFLFTSAEDHVVRRLDLRTGGVVGFTGHASWVRGMAFISHTRPVVRAVTDPPPGLLAVGGGPARPAAPRPEPFTVVSGDYHGRLLWWRGDLPAPQFVWTAEAHAGWVRAVAVSPDGSVVASCGNDHLVKLWRAADGSPVRTLAGHDCHVYNLAFHPTGDRLASCDLKGVVKDWDWRAGRCVRDLDAKPLHKYDGGFRADIGGARGMAFDGAGWRLAVAGITNVSNAFAGIGKPLVMTLDWATGKPTQHKPKEAFEGTAWGVAFHPSGAVVAAGARSGGRVWVWAGDDPAGTFTTNVPSDCRDLALSPAGDRVAVACYDGTVYLYALALTATAPPPRVAAVPSTAAARSGIPDR
ncbi:MAG: hypothetical protein K2X87_28835 [Gemmataceae bacterium]|nr:hypothetical protein [Gemmataceae bacterium]